MLDTVDPDFCSMASWLLFEHTSAAEWEMPVSAAKTSLSVTEKMNNFAVSKPGQSASEQNLMASLTAAMIEEIDKVRAQTFNASGRVGLPTLREAAAARKVCGYQAEVNASPDDIMRAVQISCAGYNLG